jgi:hypothetical protein
MDDATSEAPSERTTVRRLAEHARYDRATIHAILDEGLVCHLGFATGGRPFVIPTIYGRDGDLVYVHGSVASRMLRTLSAGAEACLTVTLVDGLVLARSAFHHSLEYRSVVLFGHPNPVSDRDEKLHALRIISEQTLPDRWDDSRPPNEAEMRQTSVLSLPIDEASAKVSRGPSEDEPEDLDLDTWAGVLPLVTHVADPAPAPDLAAGIASPDYLPRGALGRRL